MKAPKRIASVIINALKGGVVPRIGLPYITVGRDQEIRALLHDVDIIADGGASFRFIVGKYGSGKSFLLQTIRGYVMDRNFVVVDADLSPERRLHGTKGQGLATYRELIRNMSPKTRPEGGALTLILDRWINNIRTETAAENDLSVNDPGLESLAQKKIYAEVSSLNEMVHGFDFARLLTLYYDAYKAVYRTVFADLDSPVLYNLNFGHATPRCLLPYDADTKVDFDRKTVVVQGPILR